SLCRLPPTLPLARFAQVRVQICLQESQTVRRRDKRGAKEAGIQPGEFASAACFAEGFPGACPDKVDEDRNRTREIEQSSFEEKVARLQTAMRAAMPMQGAKQAGEAKAPEAGDADTLRRRLFQKLRRGLGKRQSVRHFFRQQVTFARNPMP